MRTFRGVIWFPSPERHDQRLFTKSFWGMSVRSLRPLNVRCKTLTCLLASNQGPLQPASTKDAFRLLILFRARCHRASPLEGRGPSTHPFVRIGKAESTKKIDFDLFSLPCIFVGWSLSLCCQFSIREFKALCTGGAHNIQFTARCVRSEQGLTSSSNGLQLSPWATWLVCVFGIV